MSEQTYHRSTDVIAPRDQFAYWRDAISDAYVPLEPERSAAPSFRGRIDGLLLPELHGSTITAQAHMVRLSAAGLSARAHSPFFVNLMRAGEAVVTQDGRTMRAGPGDVYVVDCASRWEVDFRSDFRMFCIEIPEGLLRPQLGRNGRLTSPVLEGAGGAGRVLASYMRLINELPPEDLLHVQAQMVRHCSDLLSRAQSLGTEGEGAARARRDMLERVLALVRRRLAEPDLSPASACAELGISRSYLFKILAEHGLSFSAYVRQCRLERCREAIAAQPRRAISEIAADWGFDEVSTFNRAYRARFGSSPGRERGGTRG